MKILVTEFRQESNSLNPVTSGLEFWREAGWLQAPSEVRAGVGAMPSAVAGMLEVLDSDPRVESVLLGPAYYAQSGGTAEQAVMDHYTDALLPELRANLPLDGVFLSVHGALQTTAFDDAEAEVARRIREVVGEECVISVSCDLHGFVSAAMAERIDVICGYRTYPHVDFVETGRRAARLGLAAIAADPAPALAWVPVPMMVSAAAYNTLSGPFARLMDRLLARVEAGEILDATIFQMQPWLDVPEPSSTVIALAEDPAVASRVAAEIAAELYAIRGEMRSELHTIDEVIDRAERPGRAPGVPVLLVDSADSPNAGATGDSMAVARRLLERGSAVRAATVVRDPAAAARAHELGVGARAVFRLGGAIDPHSASIEASGYVRSLHDGEFRMEKVGSSGDVSRLGRSAVIRFELTGAAARPGGSGTLDVLVCEAVVAPGDPQLYRGVGIEPRLYDLVVIKANTSFRAGYAEIVTEICETDTPGAAGPDVERLPFTRLGRHVYPFLDREGFEPEPRVFRL